MELRDYNFEGIERRDGEIVIRAPNKFQPIGETLRSAFTDPVPALPDELEKLLDRLR